MNLSYAVKAIAAKVEAEHGMTKLAQLLRPNPAQEAAILRSLQEQCTAAERARLLTQTKRHAIIHDGKLWTLNCPVVATNSAGMAIVLGSITDEIGKVDHVAIPASEFFDGGVIVLAKNKDVTDNNMATIDAVPEELQPPPVADGAAAANAPPMESPVFTSLGKWSTTMTTLQCLHPCPSSSLSPTPWRFPPMVTPSTLPSLVPLLPLRCGNSPWAT